MKNPSDEFAMKLKDLCSTTPPDYTAPAMTARLVDIARNQLALPCEDVVEDVRRQWSLHDTFTARIKREQEA